MTTSIFIVVIVLLIIAVAIMSRLKQIANDLDEIKPIIYRIYNLIAKV